MGLTALADSLESTAGRAAIVGFRDCLVNTLETAYELKGVAEFMIATQSLAPIAGVWPWDTFLTALMPDVPSGDAAKAIAQQLARFTVRTPSKGMPRGVSRALPAPLRSRRQAARHATATGRV